MTDIQLMIKDVYAAAASGDGAALTRLLADDLTYTVPGSNRFAGTHHGRNEFLAILGELAALTGGTLRNTPEQVFVGDYGAVVLQRTTAERDHKEFDMLDALVISITGAQVSAVAEYAGNPQEFDELLT